MSSTFDIHRVRAIDVRTTLIGAGTERPKNVITLEVTHDDTSTTSISFFAADDLDAIPMSLSA